MINLLKAKLKQAEMTLREKLNKDLLGGTWSSNLCLPDQADDGSYGVLPLGTLFTRLCGTDPTHADIGGIPKDTYSWWRHNVANMGADAASGIKFTLNVTTFATMAYALKKLYNYCSRGTGGSPDLAVMDQAAYETYESGMDSKIRYQNTKMADMGFDTIKCKGATCIWDEVVPDMSNGYGYDSSSWDDGSVFMLNTKFYRIFVDSATNFITTPFIEPENQTAKTAKILWMGNATVSNMRKCGIGIDIIDSITS